MAKRDGISSDYKSPENSRYYRGQTYYLEKDSPKKFASIVIDNNDFLNPVTKG